MELRRGPGESVGCTGRRLILATEHGEWIVSYRIKMMCATVVTTLAGLLAPAAARAEIISPPVIGSTGNSLVWRPDGRKAEFRGTLTMPKTVTPAQAGKLFLQLGYEDDGYGDNGYYGHDDGTFGQAKGVGAAYVIIEIVQPKPVTERSVFENSFK